MTKSIPRAFPDGGFGVSGRTCKYCTDWIRESGGVGFGFCDNAESDHYGHLLLSRHPACECYCKRRIEEG